MIVYKRIKSKQQGKLIQCKEVVFSLVTLSSYVEFCDFFRCFPSIFVVFLLFWHVKLDRMLHGLTAQWILLNHQKRLESVSIILFIRFDEMSLHQAIAPTDTSYKFQTGNMTLIRLERIIAMNQAIETILVSIERRNFELLKGAEDVKFAQFDGN